MEKENIEISALNEADLEDTSFDLEEIVQKKLNIEKLHICLAELSSEDREFILDVFSGEYGILNKIAKEKGIHRKTLARKREAILKELKENFFK